MATRREQKDQARAARVAKQQEAAQQAARRRRFQIFGGLIGAAVIVVAIVVVLSVTGGKSATSKTTAKVTSTDYSQIATQLAGIPQSGTQLGNPGAPITMYYYADLGCPVCAKFSAQVFPKFVSSYVRTGKVKVEYRSFCTATCNMTSVSSSEAQQIFERQQVAAMSAGTQDKFWNYAEFFYRNQGTEGTYYATPAFLLALAKQVKGMSISKWQNDRKDPSFVDQINTDDTDATNAKIDGTPTLVMQGPKGESQAPTFTYSSLVQAIKAVS
jgi:protein-disulfide isomerase